MVGVAMDRGLGQLLEAAHFAACKHRDQRRKDPHGTPYINHPLGVAYLLWKEGGVTDLATLQVCPLPVQHHCNRYCVSWAV